MAKYRSEGSLGLGSAEVISVSLGLLLLSLFISLSAYRFPNTQKEQRALRSVSEKFKGVRQEQKILSKPLTPFAKVKQEADIIQLSALMEQIFSLDGLFQPDVENHLRDIAAAVVDGNTAVEILCSVPASQRTEELYLSFLRMEKRCEKIRGVLRDSGVSSFQIVVRTGAALDQSSTVKISLQSRPFRSSWQ
jgi:hypothetical protein